MGELNHVTGDEPRVICVEQLATVGNSVVLMVPLRVLDDSVPSELLAEEQQSLETIGSITRRRQFVTGRIALRRVVGQLLGYSASGVSVRADERGKPCLHGLARSDINVAIAHSGQIVAVAASLVSAVGVDVERVRPVRDWRRVAARALANAVCLASFEAGENNDGVPLEFLRSWCDLESVLKARGTGFGGESPAGTVVAPSDATLTRFACRDASGECYVGSVAEVRRDSITSAVSVATAESTPVTMPATASTP